MEKRPTAAVIDIAALKYNYERLRGAISPDVRMMAIVKANAYGHGDVKISAVLEELGCDFLGVAIPEEGFKLRENGIKLPIVVLGGIYPGQIKEIFEFDLTPVVFDIGTVRLISNYAKKAGVKKKIHVKIDTGMGRLGLLSHQVEPFFRGLKELPNIELESLLSHFSESEDAASEFNKRQVEAFSSAIEAMRAFDCTSKFIDMANSAAVINNMDAHFNLVRPGLMLYGAYPAEHLKAKVDLRPVMSLKTKIMHLKTVPAGFFVSYGRKFVTDRESVIATLPIGYADGLPRSIMGKGSVLIRGKRAPIVGTICMDLAMCDVTDVADVMAGEEVVLIGAQEDGRISVEEFAGWANTISYEILCGISARVPRVYIQEK